MDYNDKLQSLIMQASQNGYEFSNGKFEKTKLEKFPVMEMFLIKCVVKSLASAMGI